MADDDQKLSFSERDRLRREGGDGGSGGRPPNAWKKAEEEKRSRATLQVADSLFTDAKGGQAGKALAEAVRAAHGTDDLAPACRAYLDGVGPPSEEAMASLFLDADDKDLAICALDELLQRKAADTLQLEGGLKRQIRVLSEDFDDDLASRAEDLLE